MHTDPVILRFILLAVFSAGLFLMGRAFPSDSRKTKSLLLLHLTILTLFFSGLFGRLPYTPARSLTFDLIWWLMALLGVTTCLFKAKTFSRYDYLLVPTTLTFLLFIPWMILLAK